VAIVGAGPTGLAVAAALKGRGIESVLLERGDAVGESGGGAIHVCTCTRCGGPGLLREAAKDAKRVAAAVAASAP
jgi:putative flavoprotein involved in K+ transport